MEKRRCSNCGAFLGDNEKVCYVCGEVQIPDVVNVEENDNEGRDPIVKFEKDEDFVVPDDSHGSRHTTPDERVDYGDEDIAEPYYEMDNRRAQAYKKRNRKAIIIAVVVVLVLGAIGAVCFCIFNGVFDSGKKADNNFTIYFDKPNSEIDLVATDGTVYNWSNDVCVSYTINNKETKKTCTPCADHDSLWEISIPTKAKTVYFYESEEENVRTQVLPSVDDETVYYVSQEAFNVQNQLPLGQCTRDAFEGIGINYATTAETSESSASDDTNPATSDKNDNTGNTKKTEPTETKDENDTRKKVDNGTYTIELPQSWQSGVTEVKGKNYTTYYEDYNYKMSNMGKLATIYVFDADDTEADNLTGVKRVFYNSDQTKKIVITTPTDIQFDESDEEAQKNYIEKNKDLNSVLDSISAE